MPIGVLSGKKEIMKFADTSGNKKSERAYIGGGTFSANPMSMTSGFATLSELKKSKNMIYPKINSLGKFARDELGKIFGSKVIITGKGSLFMTHFVSEGITEITNSAQAAKCDTKSLYNYHFKMIAQDGIFFLPGKLGAISNVHTKEDIKKIITATDNFEQARTSK
ncbi:MAG: aspartate aminotransferase family protein, partial [Nitrosarchaeum sp.]|nr:aspartate aminotransferase family protein [Nitrosarchaeum sp.]